MIHRSFLWIRTVLIPRITPSPGRALFIVSSLAHGLIARLLLGQPFPTLRLLTTMRPVSFVTAEIARFLGGMHLGMAMLAAHAALCDLVGWACEHRRRRRQRSNDAMVDCQCTALRRQAAIALSIVYS